MCNCGGAGTVSNQTSNNLSTQQPITVPQPTADQVAAAQESQKNALANAKS